MPCKIADDISGVQPVSWGRLAGPTKPQSPLALRAAAAPNPSGTEELERQRQAELAQCKKSALQEGVKQGKAEAALEIQSANERLAKTLHELASLKRKIRCEAEADLVKLSLAVARRVLHRELTTDPESIQGVIHAALGKMQNRDIARVRAAPAAVDLVRSGLERLGANPTIHVVPDAKLGLGDLIFETAMGELDASVDTQLREIERGFVDRLEIA